MKARAPGKLVLTGAYAVLEGAPALVAAVDRHAIADGDNCVRTGSPELRALFGDAPAPKVDTSALYEDGVKLGFGSSAAVVVAALATTFSAERLASSEGRRELFERAKIAHHEAQGGGSGADIAASTYGGLVEYRMAAPKPIARTWPSALKLQVYFAGKSAKTSELVRSVRELAGRDRTLYERVMSELCEYSVVAAENIDDHAIFLAAAQRFARGLMRLGEAAQVPIVTPAFAELSALAEREGAAFFGAGAGGGDVAVHLSTTAVSSEFETRALDLGLSALRANIDTEGARLL